MFEKEAEEYVKHNYCEMCIMADDCKSGCIDCFTVKAYLAGAEPREKRIAELEAEIDRLNGDLGLWESGACRAINLDKCGVVKDLEAQIEKMKCCENCRYCNKWGEANSNSPNCKKCNWVSNWKLRR